MKEKKPIFTFSFELTYVKVVAFLILMVGTVFSLINGEGTVISLAIVTCGGLLGYRKLQETSQRRIELERDQSQNPDINEEA